MQTVIENVLQSYQEHQALEEAPRSLDPLQQTVATTIQGHMNRPEVERQEALAAIRFLSQPLQSVVIKELRGAYRTLQADGDVVGLLNAVVALAGRYAAADKPDRRTAGSLRREDLRLICFDHLLTVHP